MEDNFEDVIAPVIIQDSKSLEVLMLGYMNKHAYYETLKTGNLVLYNRSTKRTEIFGLSCEHEMFVKEFYCNHNVTNILIKVIPSGNFCESCKQSFFKRHDMIYMHCNSLL